MIGQVIYTFHSAKCVSNTLVAIDKQQIEFSGRANYRSKNRNDFSKERSIVRKFTVNHRAMGIIVRKIAQIKTIGVTKCGEISSKYRCKRNFFEKPGISSKFVCITFAQYCR